MFKGLISQKELTADSMQPILEQYRYYFTTRFLVRIRMEHIDMKKAEILDYKINRYVLFKFGPEIKLKLFFRLHLISKNVASEIASKIIDNVRSRLVGKTISTFASVKKVSFLGR